MRWHIHKGSGVLTHRRIRQLFESGLDPRTYERLLADVASCPTCAASYRRYLALESAMCRGERAAAHFRLERVGALVLDRAGAASVTATAPSASLRASRLGSTEVPRQAARRPLLAWRFAGVASLAAAIAALLVVVVARPPESDRVSLPPQASLASVDLMARGLVARGSESLAEQADVGIRMFRVLPGNSKVSEAAQLSVSDVVTFTYTNAVTRHRYLSLLGIQADGRLHWYYPDEREEVSVTLRAGAVDEPLGDGFRLSVRHEPGWLRVIAVFSDEPAAKRTVEAQARALAESPEQCQSLKPLRLEGLHATEVSVLVELLPARTEENP